MTIEYRITEKASGKIRQVFLTPEIAQKWMDRANAPDTYEIQPSEETLYTHEVTYPDGYRTQWGPHGRRSLNAKGEVYDESTGIRGMVRIDYRTGEFKTPEEYVVATTGARGDISMPSGASWFAVNFVKSLEHAHSSGKANVATFGGEYGVFPITLIANS